MRHKKQKGQWRKRIAAVLAVLFLGMAVCMCFLGESDSRRDTVAAWQEQIQQQIQQRLLRSAVGFLSPAMGMAWDLADREGKDAQETVSEAEWLLLAEQSGQTEWEQLLLAEQQGHGETQSDSEGEDSAEIDEESDSYAVWMPEDGDEQIDGIERDADLLAEIDRENEAMRQLVQQLQENLSGAGAGEQEVQTAGQVLTLPYSMEQLSSLSFLTDTIYTVNKSTKVSAELLNAATLLAMDMRLQEPDSGGPKILIHHTHATEYFSDSDAQDEATLIVGVGDYLAELLENRYGIQVIHDKTVYPYNEAYSQALKHVETILEENPTIEVFIDLHRDAGGTKKYTVNVDGKETANLMFFNGLSRTQDGPIAYLPNENLQSNLAFSFQMKMAGDSLYPGLCKRNYLKAYRYNLHVLPRSVIVEVGDNNNTLQEAKNAMEPLARILAYVLTGEG